MVRTRRNNFSKTLKDYLVPIVGLVLVVIIIINSFSGDNDIQVKDESIAGVEVMLDGSSSEAYVVYPGDSKKKIEGEITFYPGEKILVKEGIVNLSYLPGVDLSLNRLGELKYGNEDNLSLFSSDLWVNTSAKLNINMRYADVNISEGSVLSLSQNEVGSTVYLLDGKVEVSNLAGKSTMLTGGQKLTVSRENAAKSDYDIQIDKDDLDNFFKSSDWFIKNSGDLYLVSNLESEETTSTGTTIKTGTSLISVTSFKDEERVNTSNIDIKGKYSREEILIITINGKTAKINEEEKTFILEGFSLENSTNDIVFKVFDLDRNIIGKYVYTVYLDNSSNQSSTDTGFKVKTFNIDATNFKFTAPSTSGTFTTYENFVTIKGSVPAGVVSKVVINDYKLNSFNGTTWRYHARSDYNNLKEGTNVYEVKYYDKAGSLIYTNYYNIIKKVVQKSTNIISDEASIN